MNKHLEQARQAFASLTQKLGLTDVVMTEQGEATLDFVGHEVLLLADLERPLLRVQARVCSLEREAPAFAAVLAKLLEANAFADKLADAWFAYSRELEAVLLLKQVQLDGSPLDAAMDDFLRVYEGALQSCHAMLDKPHAT